MANMQPVAKLPDWYRSCHFILEGQEHLMPNKQLDPKLSDRYRSCHFILEHLLANNQIVAKLTYRYGF